MRHSLWAVLIRFGFGPLFFAPIGASAQVECVLPISRDVIVVNNAREVDATFKNQSGTYWICSGGNLEMERGNNTYYVEAFGRVYVSGGKHRVYLKAGATLVMAWGAQVSVIMDPGATIKNESITSQPDRTDCPGLKFNYIDAPADGCPGIQRQPDPVYVPVEEPNPMDPLPTSAWGPSYQAMLVPISPVARPISSPRREMLSNRQYWVCSQGALTLDGNSNIIFLEAGARLDLRGSNNLVYMRNGAHIRYMGGYNNLILAEQGADVPQGNYGGEEQDWGYGWYWRSTAPRATKKWGGVQGRGLKPVEPDPEPQYQNPQRPQYPQNPQQPQTRPWPPQTRPQNPQPQPPYPTGAIGPRPPQVRLEWLEYLEFDYRTLGYGPRCQ